MKKVPKLNPKICINFRNAVNKSPTLSCEKEKNDLYNLFCAVMDRLDSAVTYLNNHWDYPDTEEDFICFLTFACILNDGVAKVYERTIGQEPICDSKKTLYKDLCIEKSTLIAEKNNTTNKKVFEYIRSLAFAHPYSTDRNSFFKSIYGKQVSPWVVVSKHLIRQYPFDDPIGIRTYSSKPIDEYDICDMMFSFSTLQRYLLSKFNALKKVTQWITEDSEKTYSEWKKEKVNRSLSPTDTLKDICKILNHRHENTYGLEQIIAYLELPITDDRNANYVNMYRDYIVKLIPYMCDCVDNLDSANLFEAECQCKNINPDGLHQMAYYQLEKINSYLYEKGTIIENGSNEEWGLIQAKSFYEQFANKWVYMKEDIHNMDYTEIKLLVTVALFMECKEQGKIV